MPQEKSAVSLIIMAFVTLIIGIALLAAVAPMIGEKTTLSKTTETIDISGARGNFSGTGAGSTAGISTNYVNSTYRFHLTNGCPYASPWRKDLGSQCYINDLGVTNASGATLSDSTDYVLVQNGATCTGVNSGDVYFKNSTVLIAQGSNTTYVTYSYCADTYQTSSMSRSILNMVAGFIALMILIYSVYCFYRVIQGMRE